MYLTIHYWSLMSCHPCNPKAEYQLTDHSMDNDWYDHHDDDEVLVIQIPTRSAAFQLIKDLCDKIAAEISAHAELIPQETTTDITLANGLIQEILEYIN